MKVNKNISSAKMWKFICRIHAKCVNEEYVNLKTLNKTLWAGKVLAKRGYFN